MKERPILFSGPMVRAILEDRKTQTRRIVKMRGVDGLQTDHGKWRFCEFHDNPRRAVWQGVDVLQRIITEICPYGVPGDRLIVKEATWQWCRKVPNGKTKTGRPKYRYLLHGTVATGSVIYAADHPQKPQRTSYAEPNMVWHYKHARFMQKHLSRIALEITDVRVQRVQEISAADCFAEGIVQTNPDIPKDPQIDFQSLWDSINAARGYGWDANPWAWAITFKRL